MNELRCWKDQPEMKRRLEIRALNIKKLRIEELKAEINELQLLKNDIDAADYKNLAISEFKSQKENTVSDQKSVEDKVRENSPDLKIASNF